MTVGDLINLLSRWDEDEDIMVELPDGLEVNIHAVYSPTVLGSVLISLDVTKSDLNAYYGETL